MPPSVGDEGWDPDPESSEGLLEWYGDKGEELVEGW
jgi:hypothetical protein